MAPRSAGADLDRAAAALGEDLLEHLELRAVLQLALHDDQRRDRQRARVVLEHELLGDDRQRLLALVVEVERLAVAEDAVADLEDLRVGLGPLDGDGDRVVRPGALVGDPLALEQRPDGLQPVALERRPLVVLLAGAKYMRCSRSRSICLKRPDRNATTPSIPCRYSSLET